MKFNLDTNNRENISLKIEDNECEDISLAIQEFAFGIASFFTDFMMRLNCDTEEKARKVQEVCMSCIKRDLNVMIKETLLNNNDEELKSEIENVIKEMENKGFSKEEISNITKIIEECGSLEDATYFLRKIGEENDIDWDSEVE